MFQILHIWYLLLFSNSTHVSNYAATYSNSNSNERSLIWQKFFIILFSLLVMRPEHIIIIAHYYYIENHMRDYVLRQKDSFSLPLIRITRQLGYLPFISLLNIVTFAFYSINIPRNSFRTFPGLFFLT